MVLAVERSTSKVKDGFAGVCTLLLTAAQDALARPLGPPSGKGENDPHQDPDPPLAG